MNSYINRAVGLMSAVFDGVCKLFVKTIHNIFIIFFFSKSDKPKSNPKQKQSQPHKPHNRGYRRYWCRGVSSPFRVYKQLYPNSVDSDGEIQGLGACSMKLTAFNHTNINVMGQIRLPVKHRDVVKNINFIVTNIDTATIIGRMMQLTSTVSSSCVITVTSVMMITCV